MTKTKQKEKAAVPGEMHRIDMERNAGENLKRRDAELYVLLGLFMCALAIPVLIGTYFAVLPDNYRPAVVNFVCGVTLAAIGAASVWYGWTLHKRMT